MPQYSGNEISISDINEAVKCNPELKNIPISSWQECYDFLTEQGFYRRSIVQMVINYPKLLQIPHVNLSRSLECWRGTQFGEKHVVLLLEKHSHLFEYVDANKLILKVNFLLDIAETRKNTWKLFMNSPSLPYDNLKEIQEKATYIKNKMRADVESIVSSKVFSNTIETIKCRHIFLVRLGLYKTTNKRIQSKDLNKNPAFNQIMDTSDKKFASKVGSVTAEEYDVFRELYMRELDAKQELEDDDISDDELE